jgi:hypothetical protein
MTDIEFKPRPHACSMQALAELELLIIADAPSIAATTGIRRPSPPSRRRIANWLRLTAARLFVLDISHAE